ncbi:hypothetical protein [Reichenbachiella sp.]
MLKNRITLGLMAIMMLFMVSCTKSRNEALFGDYNGYTIELIDGSIERYGVTNQLILHEYKVRVLDATGSPVGNGTLQGQDPDLNVMFNPIGGSVSKNRERTQASNFLNIRVNPLGEASVYWFAGAALGKQKMDVVLGLSMAADDGSGRYEVVPIPETYVPAQTFTADIISEGVVPLVVKDDGGTGTITKDFGVIAFGHGNYKQLWMVDNITERPSQGICFENVQDWEQYCDRARHYPRGIAEQLCPEGWSRPGIRDWIKMTSMDITAEAASDFNYTTLNQAPFYFDQLYKKRATRNSTTGEITWEAPLGAIGFWAQFLGQDGQFRAVVFSGSNILTLEERDPNVTEFYCLKCIKNIEMP